MFWKGYLGYKMAGFDGETIRELGKHGAGFLAAMIMFVTWLYTLWTNEKRWEGFIKANDARWEEALKKSDEDKQKLIGILTDRKNDRDRTMALLERNAIALEREDSFRKFAETVIANKDAPDNQKRRVLDQLLSKSISQVAADKGE
jgi:hypothetical protein